MPNDTFHTIAVRSANGTSALRRRIYRLTVGRGREAMVRRCTEDMVTLGSHEGNTIVIPHPTVSRFHARIELDSTGWLLTDLGSTNGTFVSKMRVRAAYLKPSTKLALGEAEVGFDVDREEAELLLPQIDRFGALIGQSSGMRRLFEQLAQVAPTSATVLIQGETGTGKDLVAGEIHQHSPRRGGPFVVVDCGGLPDTLIEAELFGHERGAFTGADRSRAGAFEEADGGTLFLDEVAELPLTVQAKLLRVLEARTVKRLGSNDWKRVDVRVVAATHHDLARLCNQRQFREDLYFRLAVLTLHLPPLRERPDDLALLVRAILEELGAIDSIAMDEPLLNALRGRHWAGNVRELRNVVERAIVLGTDTVLLADNPRDGGDLVMLPPLHEESFKVAKARAIEQFEKSYLFELLERHHGNVALASRTAEVDPAWIFRLVKRHGIDMGKMRRR
jgi:transcriptional regulator with GAF, ATPase, and Fis domain